MLDISHQYSTYGSLIYFSYWGTLPYFWYINEKNNVDCFSSIYDSYLFSIPSLPCFICTWFLFLYVYLWLNQWNAIEALRETLRVHAKYHPPLEWIIMFWIDDWIPTHTNLCQWRTLIWSRNSYDTQLLCLCQLLSHGHDWVFPFYLVPHKCSNTMCTRWEFFHKKTKIVDVIFWVPLLQSTLFEFCALITHRVLVLYSYIPALW